VSGVQLLGELYDPSPRPALPPPAEPPRAVPPLPSGTTQLVRAVEEGVRDGVARARALVELLRDPPRALAELRRAGEALSEMARIALVGAPTMPFNGHVSILRRVVWTSFSLNEMKAVKNRLGGTVNDVVLATITTALRGYLEAHEVSTDRLELRAMLPVNVRGAHEHLALGNRVSALIAPLPVGLFDPHERFRQIRAATAQLKRRNQSALMTHALDLFDLVPPLFQKPLEWFPMAPPVNTVCTNVPGPPVSLYCQGRRLETLVPIVPLAQGVGLAFAILSYAEAITIGITVDPALVPDAERFCDLLQAGFDELRALAGVEPARRPVAVRSERLRRRVEPSQVA
jgi:WS/DGAT/MGAT family acyltransferase